MSSFTVSANNLRPAVAPAPGQAVEPGLHYSYFENGPIARSAGVTPAPDLSLAMREDQSPADVLATCKGMPLKEYLESIEIALIDAALKQAGGIVAHAAETLQIRRTTLSEKMKRYGIGLDTI